MFAKSVSARELRTTIAEELAGAGLTNNPALEQNPTFNPGDQDLPQVDLFDAGRSGSSTTLSKLLIGEGQITLGFTVTVKAKLTYADDLDILTEEVVNTIITSQAVNDLVNKIDSYSWEQDFEAAAVKIARNAGTMTFLVNNKFSVVATNKLESAVVTNEISDDENKNNSYTFTPEQTP